MNRQLKIVGSLVLCAVILLWIFLVKVYEVKNNKHFSLKNSLGTHRHKPVTVADIAYISPWMTFDYINRLFDLPQNYLEQSMQIHNTKYPVITLSGYAKKMNIPVTDLIESVRTEVKKYMVASSLSK